MDRVGIALGGGYLPVYRLDRKLIAEAWARGSQGGERCVANNDEDSATMAVAAALNCLRGASKEKIDGLYFATTTPPYQEKSNASLIAFAVDLPAKIRTNDFAHTLRAGTGAILSAIDAVSGGSAQRVLVTAADTRQGYPRSDQEQTFGDGSAAVLIAKDNLIATFEGSYSVANEMLDVWRNPEDIYVRTWETRFILTEGYTAMMKEAVAGLLKQLDLKAPDVAKAIFPGTDARTHAALAKSLGFDQKTQVQEHLLGNVGFCGAAHPLLMLVGALEEAQPGDVLLLAAYGDGAEAMIFRVTEAIKQPAGQRKLKDLLARKLTMSSYAKFLSYKGQVETVPGEPFRLFPSASSTWRDRNSIIRGHASKCLNCGRVAFPIQRVCPNCDAKDRFVETPISHLEGEVFTFTLDTLAGRSDDPMVIQTVAELGEDRVRFYSMMTDCPPDQARVGLPVGLTFRRIYDGGGMHNYFWKCRPLDIGGK